MTATVPFPPPLQALYMPGSHRDRQITADPALIADIDCLESVPGRAGQMPS